MAEALRERLGLGPLKLTITRNLPYPLLEKLGPHYSPIFLHELDSPLSPRSLLRSAGDAQVLLCTILDKIDSEFLNDAKELKCVITYSVGLDHIELPAVKARGIKISHTPSVLTDATADLAWALILGAARHLRSGIAMMEMGKFCGISPTLFLGKELRGSKLGILGMGRIGQAVAERAKGFGMEVIFFTPHPDKVPFGLGRAVAFSELLKESDVISVHCPSTVETRHLIGADELASMKSDAILVNTARGPIVDEEALLNHLKGHLAFSAGLDVYEREPQVTPGLCQLPNVLPLPHLGSATHRARQAMAQICTEEAIRFAKGEPLRYEYRP